VPLEIVAGTAHRDEDYGLAPEVIVALQEMEQRHFWHVARNAWILEALRRHGVSPPARFLEVGCGRGAVAVALGAAGYRVTGVDTSLEHVQRAQQRDPQIDWIVADVASLPQRAPYDAIGFFDVLEHLTDPSRLVEQALAFAAPSALVLVTVPADPSMFSAVDELSGHKRRYDPGEPSALLTALGLHDVVEYGLFRFLQPAQRWARRGVARSADQLDPEERVALMRKDLAVPAAPLNAALGWTCALERSLGIERAAGRRGGSLLAVGRLSNGVEE
jgi:SAM-dependent methyltransferase